jgi:homoaconitate hydratase
MGQTRIEKIAQRHAVGWPPGREVRAGDFLTIRPRHVMTHDNTGAVIPKFRATGASRVHDPSQPVVALDHDVQNKSPENLEKYRRIEAFAREQGLAFFPAGTGIAHQLMMEEGFVLPGSFVVGSDSHSNIYGALGALGTPVVRTDAAAIWATGQTWWQVPPVVRVVLEGELPRGVTGKDLIIALIGHFRNDEVLNCALEFHGDGVRSLTMDQRMTVANMTTEWGALAGVFPFDEVAFQYLMQRAEVMRRRGDETPRLTADKILRAREEMPEADPDAYYAKEIVVDLGTVSPQVAGPDEVKAVTPLPEIEARGVKIQKAYLLSCVNARLEDLAAAAEVLRGRKVAEGVKLYVAAASAFIEEEARRRGIWQALLEAGAIPLPPGCGPCIGLGEGTLEDGEVAISATNRNFKGRMGSRNAQAYLASPAVVAASAAAGYICGPEELPRGALRAEIRENPAPPAPEETIPIREGFPKLVEGELLFVPKDNLNTDGIYGKEYTYKDDMTPEEMGRVAMLNYDPAFQELAREGDILVGGWNFGTGSSREQAATALKHRGIQLVVAGSFSQTYKRNAFNNGFVVIECPELVRFLKERHAGDEALTIRTGLTARIDFAKSRIEVEGKTYTFSPLRETAQELVALGGLEAVLRTRLAS